MNTHRTSYGICAAFQYRWLRVAFLVILIFICLFIISFTIPKYTLKFRWRPSVELMPRFNLSFKNKDTKKLSEKWQPLYKISSRSEACLSRILDSISPNWTEILATRNYFYLELNEPLELHEYMMNEASDKCPDDIAWDILPQRPNDRPTKKLQRFCFEQVMSVTQRRKMSKALREFVDEFPKRGIDYPQLSWGNLLGSVRHLGQSPWDDDVDLYILEKDKPKVRAMLLELHKRPEYEFFDTEEVNQHWKVNIQCQLNKLSGKKDCSIQVDIFFADLPSRGRYHFREDSGHTLDLSTVYPTKWRPFDGVMLPTPNKPLRWLRESFSASVFTFCKFKNYQKHSKQCAKPDVMCSLIAQHYPMVRRYEGRSIVYELLLNGTSLLTLFVHTNREV